METLAANRVLDLPIVLNARHLGGIPLVNGLTAFHGIVRSGSICGLRPEGIHGLRDLGVRSVIDLRTAAERDLAPDPDLSRFGISQLWLPMVQQDPAPHGVRLEYGHAGFLWMYQTFLEHGRDALCQLVETLAETERVLFHCSAGEDRTGVATAVLLGLVGVSDEAILADHALSVTIESLAARGLTGGAAEQRATAPLQAMTAILCQIRDRWGSTEGYLTDAGASPAALAAVVARAGP